MEFDYKKFLTENKLTTTSRLIKEVDDDDSDVPEKDDWYSADDTSSFDDEKEPTGKDVSAGDESVSRLGGKQGELQALIQQKDAILARFKSGEITIDQYKQEIGNIPRRIKNLQLDIEKEMGEESSEEEA